MSMLEKVQSGKQQTPPRLLVYGTEGIGKSTLAANAPSPVFIQTEDGLGQIACDKFPLAESFADVMATLTGLYTEENPYRTVVIDSLDWLERLIWADVCSKRMVESIEDISYAKGYSFALSQWQQFLDGLTALRNDRGMAAILIAHAKVEKFEDPESTTYDRYSPRLHKHAVAIVTEWVDAVLFATRKIRTQVEDTGFGRTRTIAVGIGGDGGERILRTVGGPSCVAKNRYGLPAELPLSWLDLCAGLVNESPEEKGE